MVTGAQIAVQKAAELKRDKEEDGGTATQIPTH